MGFATRVTPTTVLTLDPFNTEILAGAGVTAPANGAQLLTIVDRWVQAQPDLTGRQVKAEVTQSRVVVTVQDPPASTGGLASGPFVPKVTTIAMFLTSPPATESVDVPESNRKYRVLQVGGYYLLLGREKVWRSTALNGTWEEIAVPNRYFSMRGGTLVQGSRVIAHVYNLATGQQQVVTSDDFGTTWTTRYSHASESATDFAAGGGVICAVCDQTKIAITSADGGNTWTRRTMTGATTTIYSAIAFGAGVFCAVPYDSGVPVTSADALSWTQGTEIEVGPGYASVIYDGAQFVAFPDSGSYRVARSTDGLAWVLANYAYGTPHTGHGYGGAYGAGKYAYVSETSSTGEAWASSNGAVDWLKADLVMSGLIPTSEFGEIYGWSRPIWDGSKFVTVSGAGLIATSTDAVAWTYVRTLLPTTALPITQDDIDSSNGGPVSFFWTAGLDPAYLKNPVDIVYPPTCNGYTDAFWDEALTATFGRYNPSAPVDYIVASFNGKFFRWGSDGRGTWADTFSEECKIRFATGFDRFCNELAYAFEGRRTLAGNILGPQVFFITAYAENGTPWRVALAHISANTPANLQLRSGAQYLNFVTGRLQAYSSIETCLRFSNWFQAWGNSYSRWELHLAGMPTYGAGLQPYVPPGTLTPIGGGGQDFVSDGTGYNLAPTSPFTFLVGGGFDAIAAPPAVKRFAAGFSEYTAPPLPFSAGGGFLEAGSSLQLYTSATAVTQHMGLPFTTNKG